MARRVEKSWQKSLQFCEQGIVNLRQLRCLLRPFWFDLFCFWRLMSFGYPGNKFMKWFVLFLFYFQVFLLSRTRGGNDGAAAAVCESEISYAWELNFKMFLLCKNREGDVPNPCSKLWFSSWKRRQTHTYCWQKFLFIDCDTTTTTVSYLQKETSRAFASDRLTDVSICTKEAFLLRHMKLLNSVLDAISEPFPLKTVLRPTWIYWAITR